MSDHKVTTHAGVDIFLDASGRFYATVPGRSNVTRSAKLAQVEATIDNARRASARVEALALPLVAIVRSSRWSDAASIVRYEGTFVGLNAHTGRVSIRLTAPQSSRDSWGSAVKRKVGETVELDTDAWYFRPAEAGLPEACLAFAEAVEALRTVEKRLDALQDKRGRQIQLRYGRDSGKGERAAAAEEELIAFLRADTRSGQ